MIRFSSQMAIPMTWYFITSHAAICRHQKPGQVLCNLRDFNFFVSPTFSPTFSSYNSSPYIMYVGPQLEKRGSVFRTRYKYKGIIVVTVAAIIALVIIFVLGRCFYRCKYGKKGKQEAVTEGTFTPNMVGNNHVDPVIIIANGQQRPISPMPPSLVQRSEYIDPMVDPPPTYTATKGAKVDPNTADFTGQSTASPQPSPSVPQTAYVRD